MENNQSSQQKSSMWSLVSEDPKVISDLQEKSDLLIGILMQANQQGLKKSQIISRGGITLKESSDLHKGKIDQFTQQRLKEVTQNLGMDPSFMATMKMRVD